MTVTIRSQANKEYAEIIAYYLAEETPQSAERFQNEAKKALNEIQLTPALHRVIEGNVRMKPLKAFPCSVVYSIERTEVIVLAFARMKRKFGYWNNQR